MKGSIPDVKSCLKVIPAEAFFLIDGLEAPDITVNPFPSQTDDITLNLKEMTMIEVICCLQHRKLLDFLVKELGITHSRDFVRNRQAKALNEQKFVYMPILKRDEATLATLLELINLWTLQDL